MARPDTRTLYQRLRSTRFEVVSAGEHELPDLYAAVKASYPDLCDDLLLCSQNCGGKHDRPEWEHVVRRALQAEKMANGRVSAGTKRRRWIFK